jgi:hypothetical protein
MGFSSSSSDLSVYKGKKKEVQGTEKYMGERKQGQGRDIT